MKEFKEFLAEQPDQENKIQTVFNIPEHNMDAFSAKIDKLNRTAKKLNVTPITVKVQGSHIKHILNRAEVDEQDLNNPGFDKLGFPLGKHIRFLEVEVLGEAPSLNGWTFVGKREPMEGTTSILAKSAPGQKIPKKYSDDHAITCDHCGHNRRRNETFIVKKGRVHKEVGRSCLKDFLGHADPAGYAKWAEYLYDLNSTLDEFSDSDYGGGYARAISNFNTKDVIAASIREIKNRGFVSRQYANERKQATADSVNSHFNPPRVPPGYSHTDSKKWYESFKIPVTDEDKAEAEVVIDYLKKHPKASREEFFINLSKIASSETTSLKYTGYIAAGVNGYLKEKEEIQAKAKLSDTIKTDEGAGKEGEKVDLVGTVISLFSYQSGGYYGGTKQVITAKTESGHLVKMFTSSGDSGVKKDAKVNITGKIGKVERESYDRSPFKGMMVTVMAPRSRIESIMDEEQSDKVYHVGDTINFIGDDGKTKVGVISAKPTFGKFEVKPKKDNGQRIHVDYHRIIDKV